MHKFFYTVNNITASKHPHGSQMTIYKPRYTCSISELKYQSYFIYLAFNFIIELETNKM